MIERFFGRFGKSPILGRLITQIITPIHMEPWPTTTHPIADSCTLPSQNLERAIKIFARTHLDRHKLKRLQFLLQTPDMEELQSLACPRSRSAPLLFFWTPGHYCEVGTSRQRLQLHCESTTIDAMIVPVIFAREIVDAHLVDADPYPLRRRMYDGRPGLVRRRANGAAEGNPGRHATLDARNGNLGISHRRSAPGARHQVRPDREDRPGLAPRPAR